VESEPEKETLMPDDPQIDLICNVVTVNGKGEVLLVRFGDDPRWWLPGRGLVPYEHPDEVAPKVVGEIEGVKAGAPVFREVESFRGRTGWHVMFNYRVLGKGSPPNPEAARWFATDELPQMAHGEWEKGVIERALA
jgi:ADP-ribose pyrophosphatase YjhB (NUDIX family)